MHHASWDETKCIMGYYSNVVWPSGFVPYVALHPGKNQDVKMAAAFKPIIRWAQSKERLFLTLELTDVQV